MDPVSDYKRQLAAIGVDNIEAVNKSMAKVIKDLLNDATGLDKEDYKKPLDCLETMRQGCVDYEEAKMFNDLLYELKSLFYGSLFWRCIADRSIQLIRIDENELEGVPMEEYRNVIVKKDTC